MIPWLQLVATYLPIVLQAVQGIEQAMQKLPGDAKKAVAMAVINPPAEHAPEVGKLVDAAVSGMNAGGVFLKTAPAANLGTAGS